MCWEKDEEDKSGCDCDNDDRISVRLSPIKVNPHHWMEMETSAKRKLFFLQGKRDIKWSSVWIFMANLLQSFGYLFWLSLEQYLTNAGFGWVPFFYNHQVLPKEITFPLDYLCNSHAHLFTISINWNTHLIHPEMMTATDPNRILSLIWLCCSFNDSLPLSLMSIGFCDIKFIPSRTLPFTSQNGHNESDLVIKL